MIYGFPDEPGVAPGGELELRVSTDAPAFRVELYRWGAEPALHGASGWLEGQQAPPHLPFHDWGRDNAGLAGEALPAWPAYRVPVGADWPSGVYVAVLVEGDGTDAEPRPPEPGPAPALDARSARALFVVRPRPGAERRILYKLPLLTWHAYNQVSPAHYEPEAGAGGWSLYSEFRDLPVPRPLSVSVRRPGGGTGGMPYDTFNPDPFAPTLRQTFRHWDALAVGWLERQGYAVDFCTDLDLHAAGGRALLDPYRLLLSVGHDEYYTAGMRTAIEGWVRAGGNAAFFGGNTCWWEVAFDDAAAFRRPHHWSDAPVPDRPENALTGVSFRNGGERPLGAAGSPPVGFEVQHADHWVYSGTGLADGDVFGAGREEHLVGYECDGAHFDRSVRRRGAPARPTGEDGTPPDFAILGIGDAGASGWGDGNRAATLGLHAPGGTVFTAATTDWARVLAQGCPSVERITHNVLEALG
jgi:hypothetical protein